MMSTAITEVSAAPGPKIYVDPVSATISALGENTTVTIKCENVVNYYGADFWLRYNGSVVDPVEVTVDGPGQVAPPPGPQRALSVSIVSNTVRFSCMFVYAEGAADFDGNGTVAWITFEGITEGNSTLNFDLAWTAMYEINYGTTPPTLSEMTIDPPEDGEIIVIPEFPAVMVVTLLLIATLAAASLGKIVWSRKRRGPVTA